MAERLQPYGMRTGYHNHWVEFQPMDGELPWDTFFGNTRHDVIMQLDIGNALHGGGDPIPYIARYPGRAITVHLKEHSATDPTALIGEGDVPWQRVFDLCEREGKTEWYIVEQESYKYSAAGGGRALPRPVTRHGQGVTSPRYLPIADALSAVMVRDQRSTPIITSGTAGLRVPAGLHSTTPRSLMNLSQLQLGRRFDPGRLSEFAAGVTRIVDGAVHRSCL